MTEEEALIRAREACAKRSESFNCRNEANKYRTGEYDHYPEVICAKAALLDIDKPLPVEPDLADLRLIAEAYEVASGCGDTADRVKQGNLDLNLSDVLPTFRAIIQRRIKESRA